MGKSGLVKLLAALTPDCLTSDTVKADSLVVGLNPRYIVSRILENQVRRTQSRSPIDIDAEIGTSIAI